MFFYENYDESIFKLNDIKKVMKGIIDFEKMIDLENIDIYQLLELYYDLVLEDNSYAEINYLDNIKQYDIVDIRRIIWTTKQIIKWITLSKTH